MGRLELNAAEAAQVAEADVLEAKAKTLRDAAYAARDSREEDRPLIDRLTFAAWERCACGLGMAYDPLGKVRSDKDGPFVMAAQWECSGILLGTADRNVTHTAPMPFSMWEVKSENQPSALGATTRPAQNSEGN